MIIRKITKEDLEFLNEVRNFYCEKYLHDSNKFSIEETINWFEKNNPDYYIIEIEETPIGYFRISNYSKNNNNLYIGADIHPDYRGKGFGYRAYKKFIPELFKIYNLNKISLEVLSNNEVSISLYDKLGFVVEGIKRQEVLKGSNYVDSIIMSILKTEYEE